jgi:hypothetical protein
MPKVDRFVSTKKASGMDAKLRMVPTMAMPRPGRNQKNAAMTRPKKARPMAGAMSDGDAR